MQKIRTKVKYVMFALGLFLVCAGFCNRTVQADSITFSVERFTLGGGFLIEPMTVEIGENEKYSEVIPRAIEASGAYTVKAKESSMGYYMEGINGAQCEVNVPACVKEILDDAGQEIGENKHTDVKGLYEFDYTRTSGWMYTVNNAYVEGMSSITAHDGDVVRVMYTLSLGTDIFGKVQSPNGKVYYSVADKSELMRLMAEANDAPERWQAASGFATAYKGATTIMAKMDASETNVKSAVSALQKVKDSLDVVSVSGVSMKKDMTLVEGETKELKYTFTPSYATAKTMAWSSSNPAVASVDDNGVVKAVAAGTADITLTVDGTYKAVTTVTVQKEATGITLNKTELTLQVGGASEKLTYTLAPAGSYAKVVWKSTDTDVASVSDDGVVMANEEGEAEVIVQSETNASVKAVCKVTVRKAQQPTGTKGDINGDGKCNIADVKKLLNIVSAGNTDSISLEVGDINGDGRINIADVKKLLVNISNTK